MSEEIERTSRIFSRMISCLLRVLFRRFLHNLTINPSASKNAFPFGPRGSDSGDPFFTAGGSISQAELKIVNLRSGGEWEEVGTWSSGPGGLDIKDIVWPGGSHVPPEGVPEKFHVKIRLEFKAILIYELNYRFLLASWRSLPSSSSATPIPCRPSAP